MKFSIIVALFTSLISSSVVMAVQDTKVASPTQTASTDKYVSTGWKGGKYYDCKNSKLVLVIRGDGKTISCRPTSALREPGEKPFMSDPVS